MTRPFHVPRLLLTAVLLALGTVNAWPAGEKHRVSGGETLDSISKRYGVTARAIASYNNLANPDLIVPGDELLIPPKPGDTIDYTVKRGDTLGEIAAEFGTTTDAIMATNSLTDPNRLSVGQTLRVPVTVVPEPPHRYPLPTTLRKDLDRVSVNPNRWKYIVIHHSATDTGTIKGLDNYHRKQRHMENGLAYHFVIGNGSGIPDGKIEIGNRWTGQLRGGHLASEAQNQIAIGICLIGNFDKSRPTDAQMKSLHAIVHYLKERCRIADRNIKTHTQINKKPTRCPGRHFPTSEFIRNL